MLKKYIKCTDFVNIDTIDCENENKVLVINEIGSKVNSNKRKTS